MHAASVNTAQSLNFLSNMRIRGCSSFEVSWGTDERRCISPINFPSFSLFIISLLPSLLHHPSFVDLISTSGFLEDFQQKPDLHLLHPLQLAPLDRRRHRIGSFSRDRDRFQMVGGRGSSYGGDHHNPRQSGTNLLAHSGPGRHNFLTPINRTSRARYALHTPLQTSGAPRARERKPLESDGRHQGSRALASATTPIRIPCPVPWDWNWPLSGDPRQNVDDFHAVVFRAVFGAPLLHFVKCAPGYNSQALSVDARNSLQREIQGLPQIKNTYVKVEQASYNHTNQKRCCGCQQLVQHNTCPIRCLGLDTRPDQEPVHNTQSRFRT